MKFFFLLLAFVSISAHAAISDAPDILPGNSAALSAFGELLLSDPSSEGVEGRARFGLSDDWNVAGIIGTGSHNKAFRLGGELVYNLFPDWEGQFGVSGLASAMYINRGNGGVQFRLAPMVHKRLTGWNSLPALVYASIPFSLEARGGKYTSGSQLVLGSIFDISEAKRFYVNGEAGIRLAKAESYVLLGFGMRLGDMRFDRKQRSGEEAEHRERNAGEDTERKDRKGGKTSGKGEKEYRDDDFQ